VADLLRTSNPALNDKIFQNAGAGINTGEVMTLNGTVNKTGLLLLFCVGTAAYTWHLYLHSGNPQLAMGLAFGGLIGGLIFALITAFKMTWSPVTAPIYALFEGLALGGVSAMFETRYHGIAIQAVSLTFGTMFVLLLAYRSGLIPVTQKFRMGVMAATGGIAIFYLLTFVLGFFGIHLGSSVFGSGPIGIAFSVFVVIVAALNLVLDFDFIESGVRAGAPKYMEWYAAFGLMVTLVWLYLEILRLLSKMRDRN
jgi:uncharacterized YccA/Bax inhibitor family protein